MSAPQTIAGILDAAADYLEEFGWTQGVSVDHAGRACVTGAIGYASGDYYACFNATALDAIYALAGSLGGQIVAVWNDELSRTKDEVIAQLRQVAAQQRGAAS